LNLSKKFSKKVNDFIDHRFGGRLAGEEGEGGGTPVMIKSQSAPLLEHEHEHHHHTTSPQATPKPSRPSSREQITKVLDEQKRKNSTIIDEKVLNKLHNDGIKNVIVPPASVGDSDESVSSESQSRLIIQKFKSKRDNCRESRLIPKRPLDINESHITYRPFAKVSQSHPERSFLVPMIPPKALIERPDECYVPFDLYEKKGEEVKHLPKSKIDLMKMTSLLKHTL